MADNELDDAIRRLCEERGWRFKPWEIHPADAGESPSPWPAGTAGSKSWPKAVAMRRKLIAEIEGR